jgi:hypothetical protein
METYLNSLFYNDDVNDEENFGQPIATWTSRTQQIDPPEVNLHLPEDNTTSKPSLVIIGYHVNIQANENAHPNNTGLNAPGYWAEYGVRWAGNDPYGEVAVVRIDRGEPNCGVMAYRAPYEMIFPNTGTAPRVVLGARQVLLISLLDDFFEEGCDYNIWVDQCAIRTYLQPYKCLFQTFDFTFRFISTYPAITLMTVLPNDYDILRARYDVDSGNGLF